MYVYIVSDIHLECQPDDIDFEKMLIKPIHENSILVCCGDMCSLYLFDKLKKFFEYASSIYKYVIYVPGNCEYYKPKNHKKSLTLSNLNQKLDSISESFDNVHILNNDHIIINDYLITGSILWSHINYELPLHFKIVGFNKDIYNRKNKNCVKYIKSQIDYAKKEKLKHIIITHYPPSKDCLIDKINKKDKLKSMYYNNLDGLFDNNLTWIYGHCHNNKNFKIGNTHLVSNQYGKNNYFDPNFSNNFFILT
tara:strand:+ start:257 stop:1009 length:753 start_codon:yes stop_codon:yes gene_type:complete